MASSYSSKLRLELMADGEKSSTWGQITNTNLGTLIEGAIAGMATVAVSGDYSLTTNNGAADEARMAILKFTGTLSADRVITIPSATKHYLIWNACTGNYKLTIKTSGGSTNVDLASGAKVLVFCDATDVYEIGPMTELIAGGIDAVANKDYNVFLNMPFAGRIIQTKTKSTGGTCTAQFKINSTSLGGGANSVSSSGDTVSHTSNNYFAAGDRIVLTTSANSSCVNMGYNIKMQRAAVT